MGSGWLWCVNVGSLIITNIPFWWVMLMVEKAVLVWGRGTWELPLLSAQFCCALKTALKIKSSKEKRNQCWKQCPAHSSHSMNSSYECSIITVIVLTLSWPTGGYISGKLPPRAVLGTYRWLLLLLAISRRSLAEAKAVAPSESSSVAPPTCYQSAMLVYLHSPLSCFIVWLVQLYSSHTYLAIKCKPRALILDQRYSI